MSSDGAEAKGVAQWRRSGWKLGKPLQLQLMFGKAPRPDGYGGGDANAECGAGRLARPARIWDADAQMENLRMVL